MLLIFMYHRVFNANFPIAEDALRSHLQRIKQAFHVVLPGQVLPQNRPAVCLTFDDAYADFYFKVFPLLQEFRMPAVLAVPTKFILPSTTVTPEQRMAVAYDDAMTAGIYQQQATMCTWQELQEMATSGLVSMASHSHSHVNITQTDNLDYELQHSKQLLASHLQQEITTFVYPYGRMNRHVQHEVSRQYRYGMRIGSAVNYHWGHAGQSLYRIDAEHFWPQNRLLTRQELLKAKIKYLTNRLRSR